MHYLYVHYRRYYYLAIGWFCIYVLFRYEEIFLSLKGSVDSQIIILLIFQLIVVPLSFILIGFYIKSVEIRTSDSELEFKSYFKKINMQWDDIQSVNREGWRIKIKSDKSSFSISPSIRRSKSKIKLPIKGNIFKECELLKEIYLKATKAHNKGFPEGTFNK